MAEFQEVMRQWGRLCTQHCTENADDCVGCLLGDTRADVCGSYAKDNADDAKELERLVMEWAEEHPEPVYPTWLEFVWRQIARRESISDHDLAAWMENNRIPADIAQKLGLEPKEDT